MTTLAARIDQIIQDEVSNFVELVKLAGLDPERDFQNINLTNVDFTECDLSGFNFTGSNLEGAIFDGADISQTIFDVDQQALVSGQSKSNEGPVIDSSISPKDKYFELVFLVDRLHRRLLDVIRDEFERAGRSDISAVQAMLLHSIGDSEISSGELRSRGNYLGSNVSYNLKKLVEAGLVIYKKSITDNRSVRVSLSDEGKEVAELVNALLLRHVNSIEQLSGLTFEEIERVNSDLSRLDRFWTDNILYRL